MNFFLTVCGGNPAQGFAVFQYMNFGAYRTRFNAVFNQVDRQAGYIQQDTPITNMVAWWHLFNDDYIRLEKRNAQQWASDAINRALDPYLQARRNGRSVQTHHRVVAALRSFERQIIFMTIPGLYIIPDVDSYFEPKSWERTSHGSFLVFIGKIKERGIWKFNE
jgi:hypothetical protein